MSPAEKTYATPRDVPVQLSGEDGNVFAIAGRVGRALRRAGFPEAATAYYAALQDCKSYDEALALTMRTVDVR